MLYRSGLTDHHDGFVYSLRVNLDMGKAAYGWMIMKDENIPGTVVRTSTIPEELGRLVYLLTDKTGTVHFYLSFSGPDNIRNIFLHMIYIIIECWIYRFPDSTFENFIWMNLHSFIPSLPLKLMNCVFVVALYFSLFYILYWILQNLTSYFLTTVTYLSSGLRAKCVFVFCRMILA